MDCLRQFQIYISQSRTLTVGASQFDYFPTSFNQITPWAAQLNGQFFNYAILGFKNIDLYGVKMLGYVQSPIGGTSAGIVNDYSFQVGLAGQTPQISGAITTNDYSGVINNNTIQLSKYQNEIIFAEPIKSTSSLNIGTFKAQGIGAESSTEIILQLEIQMYFYYKFEGE